MPHGRSKPRLAACAPRGVRGRTDTPLSIASVLAGSLAYPFLRLLSRTVRVSSHPSRGLFYKIALREGVHLGSG